MPYTPHVFETAETLKYEMGELAGIPVQGNQFIKELMNELSNYGDAVASNCRKGKPVSTNMERFAL